MTPQEVRVHALDLGIKMLGSNATVQSVLPVADQFAAYIDPSLVSAPASSVGVKPKHTKVNYTQEQVDDLKKCSEEPTYFLKHVKIQTINGTVDFQPYFFQTGLIQNFHQHRFVLVNKARQMGGTLCFAIYALWVAMFEPDRTILIVAHKLVQALEIMDRIRFMYENLPDHIKAGVYEYNKGTIAFDNGSRIIARSGSSDSVGRGLTITHFFVDEMAYIPYGKGYEMMDAIYPCLGRGGKYFIITTPNEADGFFYKAWVSPESNHIKIELPWFFHPERDQVWADDFKSKLGADRFSREYECKFGPPRTIDDIVNRKL